MSRKLFVPAVAGAAIILAASATSTIADDTTDFTVSATIADACEFGTVSNIAFGDYDPGQVVTISKNGTMNVICTAADIAFIGVSGGNPLDTNNKRQMDDGNSNLVSYDLFDPGGNPWGSGITAFSQSFGATTTTLNFSADMPGGQNASAGAYTDTVTLTMTF